MNSYKIAFLLCLLVSAQGLVFHRFQEKDHLFNCQKARGNCHRKDYSKEIHATDSLSTAVLTGEYPDLRLVLPAEMEVPAHPAFIQAYVPCCLYEFVKCLVKLGHTETIRADIEKINSACVG